MDLVKFILVVLEIYENADERLVIKLNKIFFFKDESVAKKTIFGHVNVFF